MGKTVCYVTPAARSRRALAILQDISHAPRKSFDPPNRLLDLMVERLAHQEELGLGEDCCQRVR